MSESGNAKHSSRAVKVTLFEDRAEVVREATFTVTPGVQWVEVLGVSAMLDERSVRARVASGSARVLAARAKWHHHRERVLGREQIEALEHEAREAGSRAQAAALARQRAEGEAERIQTLLGQWAEAIAAVPRGLHEPSVRLAWRGAHDTLTGTLRSTLSIVHTARVDHADAIEVRDRADVRKREGLVEQPRIEARIGVQIEALEAGEVTIEVTYRVACALWRPEHLARLTGETGKGSLEIVTYGTAWHVTGEQWHDVELRFSTARPAQIATPPLLQEDALASRRKTDVERSRVVVESRDQAITVAGLDRGERKVNEMPGVDDGGEARVYTAPERVTLASDGRPFRVEIGRTTLAADIARVAFPERAPVAHMRATATLSQPGPLLAGPVRVARGAGLVGRARMDYVAPGEPFEIGFGPDDAVRVRRTVIESRDTTALTGTQKVKRTVTVYLSNLSRERRALEVIERIPVSEIEAVEVELLERDGWRFDARDGFVRREITLEPNGMAEARLVYEVRASSKVVMPF